MKKLLILSLVTLISSVQASSSNLWKISSQIGKSSGAFVANTCYEYLSNSPLDNKLASSNCLYTDKSMDYMKNIVDIYFGNNLISGWQKINNTYLNTITMGNYDYDIQIFPKDPKGGNNTFVLITDLDSYRAVMEGQRKHAALMKRIQVNPKSSLGTATKGQNYFELSDLESVLDISGNGKTFMLKSDEFNLSFTFGNRSAVLNGVKFDMGAMPVLKDNYAFIPVATLKKVGCSVVPKWPGADYVTLACGRRSASFSYWLSEHVK